MKKIIKNQYRVPVAFFLTVLMIISVFGSAVSLYNNSNPRSDNSPPYQPSDPSPEDGATNVDINADLSWNCSDPDGDSLTYDIYFGNMSPPSKIKSNQSSNAYDPGIMDCETTYYWKIVAWDGSHAFNASPIWEFTTRVTKPPLTPVISNNPLWWCTKEEYYLHLSTWDPEKEDIYYCVDWGDGIEEWYGPYGSTEQAIVYHDYHAVAEYPIKVKAKDINDAESNWSDIHNLIVSDPELQKTFLFLVCSVRDCNNYTWLKSIESPLPIPFLYASLMPIEIGLIYENAQIVISQDYRAAFRFNIPGGYYCLYFGIFKAWIIKNDIS